MIKKRRYCYLEFFWVSIPLYSLGFNWTVFSIKSVWKPYDSSRRGCSDTRIFFLFRFFFIHISHVPFQTTSCFILKKRFSIWIAASGKYKKCSLLASRYSLNCSLLAKQFFYLCSCSQKNRSARMLANARKDHSSPLPLKN